MATNEFLEPRFVLVDGSDTKQDRTPSNSSAINPDFRSSYPLMSVYSSPMSQFSCLTYVRPIIP